MQNLWIVANRITPTNSRLAVASAAATGGALVGVDLLPADVSALYAIDGEIFGEARAALLDTVGPRLRLAIV